jgi:hypothetical protein
MSTSPASQTFIVDNLSSAVEDGDVRTMIRACNVLMPEVAAAWGIPSPTIVFAKDMSPVSGAWLFHIIDSDPSAPGLLAYHEETGNTPDGYILSQTILQNGGAVLYAGTRPTVASALFHEIAETLVDPDCNSWWQAPNGTRFAAEIVDPVQGQIVPITLDTPPASVPVIVPTPPAAQPSPELVSPLKPVVAPPPPTVQPPVPSPATIPFSPFATQWRPLTVPETPASGATARWIPFAAPSRPLRADAMSRPFDPQSCTLGVCQAPAVSSAACVVGLADFVYPAWSNANAPPDSRFSYTGVVKSPFSIARGGYAVIANDQTNGGQPTNIYGEEMPDWMRSMKEKSGRPTQRKIVCQVEDSSIQTGQSA